MSHVERFGVSMDADLLAAFDRLIARRGYQNRSEALRDLIRKELVAEEWSPREGQQAVATVTMVYDHRRRDLPDKIIDLGHDHTHMQLATLHVHLDPTNCLEVIVLKGEPAHLQDYANQLLSLKGVKHGRFVPTTTGAALA